MKPHPLPLPRREGSGMLRFLEFFVRAFYFFISSYSFPEGQERMDSSRLQHQPARHPAHLP